MGHPSPDFADAINETRIPVNGRDGLVAVNAKFFRFDEYDGIADFAVGGV